MEKDLRRQRLLENLIYILIWLFIFAVPMWNNSRNSSGINWQEVLIGWEMLLPFFLLFLVNNFILIPYLLLNKKSWIYVIAVTAAAAMLLLFNVNYGKSPEDKQPFPKDRPQMERRFDGQHPNDGEFQMSPNRLGFDKNDSKDQLRNHRPPRLPNDKNFRPPLLREPILMSRSINDLLIIILIIVMNIAIKFVFKSIRDDRQMKALEKQKLQTELEYLKHQINPHFFMNTLNNIHALIDIDTEKAKETVIELSKMMRYILYDSSMPTISLSKEIGFLQNYVSLMKIRYTDLVDIKIDIPENVPEVQVPPLLFISFLENAFKHGISYQNPSFVHLTMDFKDKDLFYIVANSSFETQTDQNKGIGLENVKKRLELLYGKNYTLQIDNANNEYHVLLVIPITQ